MNSNRFMYTLAIVSLTYSLGCSLSEKRQLNSHFESVPISLEDLPPQVLTAEEKASLPRGTKFIQYGTGYLYQIIFPDGRTMSRTWDGKPVEKIHGGVI